MWTKRRDLFILSGFKARSPITKWSFRVRNILQGVITRSCREANSRTAKQLVHVSGILTQLQVHTWWGACESSLDGSKAKLTSASVASWKLHKQLKPHCLPPAEASEPDLSGSRAPQKLANRWRQYLWVEPVTVGGVGIRCHQLLEKEKVGMESWVSAMRVERGEQKVQLCPTEWADCYVTETGSMTWGCIFTLCSYGWFHTFHLKPP